MATDLLLSWCAGVFEAKGQIRYYRDQLGLKLAHPDDLGLVTKFLQIVEYGSVREARGGYEWSCAKQKDCREIMIRLWPYLGDGTKKKWNSVLKRRERAFAPRACPVCTTVFNPIRKKQVCCSQPCSVQHTRAVGKYTDRKTRKEDFIND